MVGCRSVHLMDYFIKNTMTYKIILIPFFNFPSLCELIQYEAFLAKIQAPA